MCLQLILSLPTFPGTAINLCSAFLTHYNETCFIVTNQSFQDVNFYYLKLCEAAEGRFHVKSPRKKSKGQIFHFLSLYENIYIKNIRNHF